MCRAERPQEEIDDKLIAPVTRGERRWVAEAREGDFHVPLWTWTFLNYVNTITCSNLQFLNMKNLKGTITPTTLIKFDALADELKNYILGIPLMSPFNVL